MSTYLHECPFCETRTCWANKGNFSECQQCGVVGTHWIEECACAEWDYLYSRAGQEAKCFNCH